MDPGGRTEPAGQVVQAALEVEPAGEVRPVGQEEQELAPEEEYLLAAHCVQLLEVLPLSLLYCPAGHVYAGQPDKVPIVPAPVQEARVLKSWHTPLLGQ